VKNKGNRKFSNHRNFNKDKCSFSMVETYMMKNEKGILGEIVKDSCSSLFENQHACLRIKKKKYPPTISASVLRYTASNLYSIAHIVSLTSHSASSTMHKLPDNKSFEEHLKQVFINELPLPFGCFTSRFGLGLEVG